MDLAMDAALSSAAGSGIAIILAKAFISKSLRDLDAAIDRIGNINSELTAITVKLESIERSHALLHEIDRKVIALESNVFGRKHGGKTGPERPRQQPLS